MNKYKLKDCIELVIDYRGKTPKKLGGDWVEKGKRVISALNVHNGVIDNEDKIRCVSNEIYSKWMKIEIQRNDCLIASEGASLGENAIWDSDEKIVLGQRLYAIRTNNNVLDPWYLAMYMQTDKFRQQVNQISTGSTVLGISQPNLLSLELLLPDIETQRKVGKLYKCIFRKITINEKINKELEAILKDIYNYWFLQFEFPNEEGKPYKSSGGNMIWNEKLKMEIPKGWDVEKLEKNINLINGISYTTENIKNYVGTPMINLSSIDIKKNYKANEIKFFEGSYNTEKEVFCGDMLIACTDLTRNADIIGSPILVPDEYEKYLYTMDLVKLEVVNGKINPLYLYAALRTDFYCEYIKKYASGTNVLHLNTDGIKEFKMIIPTRGIQDKFARIIEIYHNKKCNLIRENKVLISLKEFILPLLSSGQIEIRK